MGDLKKLWQYQQVDAELDAINAKLRKSAERKLLSEAKAYIIDAKENMNRIEEQADRLIAEMERLESEHKLLMAKLKDLSEKFTEDAEEGEQIDRLRREIQYLMDNAAGIEKNVRDLMNTADNLKKKYSMYAGGGAKKRKEYDEVKVRYDEIKAAVDEEARGVIERLKAIEKDVDPEQMKEYRRIKKAKPNPLAPMNGNRCTGCNMELPPKVAKEVAAGESLVECENCGRILIVL
ncbi:MAG: hypothetical protein KIG36_01055 [Eubacteriales bacterium]|nr:hypothetical protein [Eubacteriales bacterium]